MLSGVSVSPSPLASAQAVPPLTGIHSPEHPGQLLTCRSSYVITFFFMLITAAVLAETCSALPAAGSIYLSVPISITPELTQNVAGQQNLAAQSTVVSSASSSLGGPPPPGPPFVHLIRKPQQTTSCLKSTRSIYPSPRTSPTLNSVRCNGSFRKCFSRFRC